MLLALIMRRRTGPHDSLSGSDESMILALRAAGRGVKVSVIVPERWISFSHPLRESFVLRRSVGHRGDPSHRGGLLHQIDLRRSRDVDVQDSQCMRSLWLNYELALFVYEPQFEKHCAPWQGYIEQSVRLDAAVWAIAHQGEVCQRRCGW
jgi:cardiolipin synthase